MSDEYTGVDAKIDAAYVAWLTANGLRHGDSYFAGATFAAGFRAALDTLIPVEPTPEIQEPGRSEAETEWGWRHDATGLTVPSVNESEARHEVGRFPRERTLVCRESTPWRVAGTTEAGDDRG